MAGKTSQEALEKKIDFLKTTIEATEKRRDSLENKASILIASNALLISILVGFGNPISSGNLMPLLIWSKILLTIMSVISILISIFFASNIIAPFFAETQRKAIMDIEAEKNLFWYAKVSERDKDEYIAELRSITSEQIFLQLANQMHNLSRLINRRYIYLKRSHYIFIFSIVQFALLALLDIIFR